METFDMKADIKVGREIFEKIPNDIRPGWAGLILSRFDNYVRDIPSEVIEMYSIIDDQERWKEAHNQFGKIRRFLLTHSSYKPESYLHLAELVAKVTYNSSGQPAPFDNDSGWYITSIALRTTGELKTEDHMEEDVKSAILIFNRNEKFKNNLKAAKDFLIYRKIDDILWFDWDPIGVNKYAPRTEYQSYVPQIFQMKKNEATKQEIAECLLKIETERMGMGSTIENCLIIANKIINA